MFTVDVKQQHHTTYLELCFFLFQFTRKLDDLLGFLYDDKEADTVESAQEALRQLQEKVDAIG